MELLRPYGPARPKPLVTIREARIEGTQLGLYCRRCDRHVSIPGEALTGSLDGLTIGEVWLQARFRCSACNDPATSIRLTCDWDITKRETWSLTEPHVAARLKHFWRWTLPR